MKILGLSAFYHDSAACITINGVIVAATQEERFNRKKHYAGFPIESISYCLEEAGLKIDDLDAVVFYDKPLLKFERLLQTYYAFAPKGLSSFLKAIPVWLDEKLFLKKKIRDGLKEVQDYSSKKLKLLFSEHHLSHAASAFYPSKFETSAILTLDGVGEWCTSSIAYGYKEKIELLKEMKFPHSIGLLYSSFTYFLGFKVNSGEYKLMGLAPYGRHGSKEVLAYVSSIESELVSIKEDGSIWLDQAYFEYATGLKMIEDKKWKRLFNLKRRLPEEEIEQAHCDLALAIQIVTEKIVLKMAEHAKHLTDSENICLAGGVALNCVANGKLVKSGLFKNVYIQPAAGDAGGALGAALAAEYMSFNGSRSINPTCDGMRGSYLGPYFSDKEIRMMSRRNGAKFKEFEDFEELTKVVSKEIASGKVIGWFQGRMEFGPRALGNRSILGDPRKAEMQRKLNLKIKYRESFRPFAPSVLDSEAQNYFDLKEDSPYMLLTAPVADSKRKNVPEDFHSREMMEKLSFDRSEINAVTHVDFSARVQTVSKVSNPRYFELIKAFQKETGCPLLVNTSFNVRGEPIVCSPENAFHCFINTEMDILVIGNFLYRKESQEHLDKSKFHRAFADD